MTIREKTQLRWKTTGDRTRSHDATCASPSANADPEPPLITEASADIGGTLGASPDCPSIIRRSLEADDGARADGQEMGLEL